ncbi:NAD dependent epimerase/dehydratase family protein [Collimonas arenae]|uniref:NAD dependent epimerase/dehydratase family protein n=1 Tax=Collimonas arenae TaxID=279058 RepID=A0A127QD90_9BURK|nr:NAD(P)-dependent oxidoreductase [Collimonas arenae]AMO98089.1 NAD dependent epimerase/dehydratase family protein [Collimonas arenae]AMP07956.1 NAD dependent epimerase/dehydratase family protein [Collimonas arenae]
MKIAIIGITGRAGSRIAAEALRRGHTVTGIARSVEQTTAPVGVQLLQGDATQPEQLAELIRGQDAVVSAAQFRVLKAAPLLQAVKSAGVKRLLVVGGAASLEVAPGAILLDSPNFPAEYKVEAVPGKQFLDDLRAETTVDWTFLSPPALFAPGERTGKFRIGQNQLLSDEQGQSQISMEDYAIALLDEIEQPKHVRQRFTVAY